MGYPSSDANPDIPLPPVFCFLQAFCLHQFKEVRPITSISV